ncbi:hypothetical protein LDENG_00219190 [Lucifuga dentata]|nr:hypothetical protein LDENG_00219190 [Lucifuga dentata]
MLVVTPGTKRMKIYQKHQDRPSPSMTSDTNTVGITSVKHRTAEDIITPSSSFGMKIYQKHQDRPSSSMTYEHSGNYICEAQNSRGHHNSIIIIWDEDLPKASGQTFTINDIRYEHSGNYICEAQNSRGHHNSIIIIWGTGIKCWGGECH